MEQVQDNRKRNTLIVIFIIAVIFISVVVFAAIILLRSPLAQHMEISTTPAATIVAAQVQQVVAPTATLPPIPAATATTAPTVAPAGTCGQTGTMTLLFNGTGVAQGMTSADAVRVIRVNFDSPEITVVAFPRDLWVKTTRLASLNMPEANLGHAFHYAQQATNGSMQEKSLAGTTAVAQALYDNFAVQPQHYMTINLESWAKMIDTIGGVEVNIPAEIKTETGLVIPAGKHVLNGQQSKDFIRSLALGGEAARLQRQNLYVQALRKKVLSSQVIPQVPDLLSQFSEVMVTDLTPEQILSLTCMVEKTSPDQLSFYEINGDMFTQRPQGGLTPNTEKIITNLNLWLNQ